MRAAMAAIAVGAIAVGGGALLHWRPAAIAFPYLAVATLFIGICWRVIVWARSPVPFRIPTTCGQEKSLPWIRRNRIDNPASARAAVARMALEIGCFRSLSRNNRAQIDGATMRWRESNLLWMAALAMHWSLLIIVLRHLRLLVEPVPRFVLWIERADGFFQIGLPDVYLSDIVLGCALLFLIWRRASDATVRYISRFSDYLAVFLLGGIAITGVLMRYFARADVVAVKQFAIGIATFHPAALPGGMMFAAHLALVCALAAYIPFSKLMHAGGIFLSPTRNLANNSRARRHVNPWNYPVKTHAYAEWEEEFHDKLVAAGIPIEEQHARTALQD